MRARSLRILAIAAVAISAPILLSAGEGASPPRQAIVVSAEVAPLLKDAQLALNKTNYDLAAKLLAQADAVPGKTADDQYIIDTMRKFILVKMAKPAMTPKP